VRTWLVALVLATGADNAQAECPVSIEFEPLRAEVAVREDPQIRVWLHNLGRTPITLVQPGDGSDVGWRTPLVRWTGCCTSAVRCGNINPLRRGEVFVLGPGERAALSGWAAPCGFGEPGTYRLQLRYRNEPRLQWHGTPLSPHDPAEFVRVQSSTACEVVSEPLIIVVKEKPRRRTRG